MSYQTMPYNQSLALLTDLYQLTMAYGYWKSGMDRVESVFHLYFRKNPFGGGFTVAAGLEYLLDYVTNFAFDDSDLAYLASLMGNDGKPMFEPGFIDYLRTMTLEVDICAMPEGTIAFPNEPLVRVQGPLLQVQLLETALLNIVNFQSLIATKAARVCLAAQGDPVLEFGLRRAQGIDGGLSASRAAYLGGCAATSNVLAGKMYGIPVKGTHAHSWVMAFASELEAFETYAEAMPNNVVLLVDTYHTIEGVKHAVEVGKKLRAKGHELAGIRLDSGDLAYLSQEARRILDAAGFEKTTIVASNDLNENLIESLKRQDAKISVWGVGTQLATAFDQPALGGVYKLSAIKGPDGAWDYKIKLSEQVEKVSNPGILQVRRYLEDGQPMEDMIYNVEAGVPDEPVIVHPTDMTRRKRIRPDHAHFDLLVPVIAKGRRVYESPSLHEVRASLQKNLAALHPGNRRFENPHAYPAGLEKGLYDMKMAMILGAKGMPV
jgi:nicotinate phosphoribosyltransferase